MGIAASGLPGMSLAPAIGMGIGAMCATMLRLPLTSALLATVLLGADGVSVTPQVIIAVVVAFVITMVLPDPGPKEPELLPHLPAPPRWTWQPAVGSGRRGVLLLPGLVFGP